MESKVPNIVIVTSGKMTKIINRSPRSGKDIIVYYIHVIEPTLMFTKGTSHIQGTVCHALSLSCTVLMDKAKGKLNVAL